MLFQFPCAAKGCGVFADSGATEGVYFDAQLLFTKPLHSPAQPAGKANSQMWACCQNHKKMALQEILLDLPYRGESKR
jgi:hypothetical protein